MKTPEKYIGNIDYTEMADVEHGLIELEPGIYLVKASGSFYCEWPSKKWSEYSMSHEELRNYLKNGDDRYE